MLMTLETRLLSVQITKVERNTYAKVFMANSPDNTSELLSSVVQMNISDDKIDEVFNYVNQKGIQFYDQVKVKFRIVRGGQNSTKNILEEIEVMNQKPQQPQQSQAQTAKA